jgi:hypothetical protein
VAGPPAVELHHRSRPRKFRVGDRVQEPGDRGPV